MKFCSFCGKEIPDNAAVCIHCGASLENNKPKSSVKADSPSIWWGIIGFFIPMAGLLLYLLNVNETPLRARSAAKGALIGTITTFILSVIIPIVVWVFYILIIFIYVFASLLMLA